jgi:hypothetical protein
LLAAQLRTAAPHVSAPIAKPIAAAPPEVAV